jgi:hypothetical protein
LEKEYTAAVNRVRGFENTVKDGTAMSNDDSRLQLPIKFIEQGKIEMDIIKSLLDYYQKFGINDNQQR